MTVEAVCAAVRVLHDPHSPETQRREADGFLRNWQTTPEAWSQADLLLRTPELSPEVHHIAAVTLRSKILYDFVELPRESHEALCRSLFEHINTFKFALPSSVIQFLVLALADFSVHTAQEWRIPVETFFEKFSHASLDANLLVMCLTALPEENANRRVLVDPAVREIHLQLLRGRANEVLSRLETVKAQAVASNYSNTFAKVLGCFVEWLPLSDDIPSVTREGSFIRDCFNLLHLDTLETLAKARPATDAAAPTDESYPLDADIGVRLSSSAVDCLCEVFRICRRSAADHETLFELALSELSGPVKEFVLSTLAAEEWQMCMNVARLYAYICDGLTEPLVTQLHAKKPLQEIMTIVFRLTEVPFSATFVEAGENGVASQIFPFWYNYVDQFASFRNRSEVGDAVNNPAAMACSMDVFSRLLGVLISAVEFPPDFVSDSNVSRVDLDDLKGFRDQVCGLLLELRRVFDMETLMGRVIEEYTSAVESKSVPRQEATLLSLQCCMHESRSVPATAAQLSTVESINASLTSDLPRTVVDAYYRISAIGVLLAAARQGWFTTKPCLIRPTLEALLGQAFLFSSSAYPQNHPGRDLLESCRRRLLVIAADAANTICRHTTAQPELLELLDSLILAVSGTFRDMSEDAHTRLLEAVGYIIAHISDDAKYLQAVESLCNPIVQSIVESTNLPPGGATDAVDSDHCRSGGLPSTSLPSKWINRLGVAVKSLKSSNPSAHRTEALGAFTLVGLWPMMENFMRTYRDCKVLIEKCDRVLKHAMRLSPEKFKEALPGFSMVLIDNGRYKMFSTYLYAAEWLATEYIGVPQLRELLSRLFLELTRCGISVTQQASAENRIEEQSDLLEDLYCMLNRYMRNCPLIAFSNDSIDQAFNLSVKVIYVEHADVSCAVFGFLETLATTATGKVIPSKMTAAEMEDFKTLVASRISPDFVARLPSLFSELIRLILKVPRKDTLERICNVIDCIVYDWPSDVVAKPLEEALRILPPNVVSSDQMRQRILVDIMTADRLTLENTLDEIHYRCRQVMMRSRASDSTCASGVRTYSPAENAGDSLTQTASA